jgi:hypothetical protein
MIPPLPSFLLDAVRFFLYYEQLLQLHARVNDDVVEPFPFELFVSCWMAFETLMDVYNLHAVYTPVQRLIRRLCVFDPALARGNGQDVWGNIVRNPENFWFLTGETPESLQELVADIAQEVRRPYLHHGGHRQHCHNLSTRNRVLLTFIWLRQYPTNAYLAFLFGVSTRTVYDEIHHILAILHEHYVPRQTFWHTIPHWNTLRNRHIDFPNVVGFIDGTPIRINTPVGPIQRLYYRRDKHFHFMNWMVIVDNDGYFVHGQAGFTGHLTDSTCFEYMNVPHLPGGLFILGDRGFPQRHPLLVPIRRGQGVQEHLRLATNR